MRRLLAPVLLLAASVAAAADVRPMRFAENEHDLLVSGSFTDVFDADLLEQMASGFAQTVYVRVYLWRAGASEPIWLTTATYRVVYAVWDEVYVVRLRDPAGERNLRFASRAEALKAVTTFHELPLAPLSVVVPGKTHWVDIVVDVNPVTPELLAEVRRWLSRPRGALAGDASFFGSFVSVFVNPRIASSDRTLRFRSQDFSRVAR